MKKGGKFEGNQLVERENEVTALTYFNSIKLDVTLSVWGIAGVGKSSIVIMYYDGSLNQKKTMGDDEIDDEDYYKMHG